MHIVPSVPNDLKAVYRTIIRPRIITMYGISDIVTPIRPQVREDASERFLLCTAAHGMHSQCCFCDCVENAGGRYIESFSTSDGESARIVELVGNGAYRFETDSHISAISHRVRISACDAHARLLEILTRHIKRQNVVALQYVLSLRTIARELDRGVTCIPTEYLPPDPDVSLTCFVCGLSSGGFTSCRIVVPSSKVPVVSVMFSESPEVEAVFNGSSQMRISACPTHDSALRSIWNSMISTCLVNRVMVTRTQSTVVCPPIRPTKAISFASILDAEHLSDKHCMVCGDSATNGIGGAFHTHTDGDAKHLLAVLDRRGRLTIDEGGLPAVVIACCSAHENVFLRIRRLLLVGGNDVYKTDIDALRTTSP
ncbi:MAG: hypothetical protein ABIG71_03750 [Candidatus Uhrbacteria bacterium]